MTNLIKEIHDFNHKAGLVNGYNDELEVSLQLEEALEGIKLPTTPIMIKAKDPRGMARDLATWATQGLDCVTDVDRLDKACDAFVLAVGSMTKLNLNPDQIIRAVGVVVKANQAKLDCPLDDHGKLTKPEGFTGPEVLLQLILDERR